MKTFTLKSEELGGQITIDNFYNDWGATGKNISPQLSWENPPIGTEAFAVTIYDPAAPTGSGWWHWVVFNIPSSVNQILQDAGSNHPEYLPKGSVQSITDFGKPGYGGPIPIPGSGFHPYVITVHALSKKLDLDSNANPALVGFQMGPLTLAKASLIAYLNV